MMEQVLSSILYFIYQMIFRENTQFIYTYLIILNLANRFQSQFFKKKQKKQSKQDITGDIKIGVKFEI